MEGAIFGNDSFLYVRSNFFNFFQNILQKFTETVAKYKLCSSTNIVECLFSIKRKYADKRLNFGDTYSLRADIAILDKYVKNWERLLLER